MVIILLPLKLKTPMSPKVPVCLALYVLPRDSAASSKTNKLYFFATLTNLSIFIGCPNI